MSDYLISPNRHKVIHLAAWVVDSAPFEGGWYGGRWVPLCNQNYGHTWNVTGPWHEKWPTHSQYAVCVRCRKTLGQLDAGLDAIYEATRP